MKILLLSDSNSSHTIKWAASLADKGLDITLFTITKNLTSVYGNYKNITVESADIPTAKQFSKGSEIFKIDYLKSVSRIKKIIKDVKPDIIHSHYATSYGLIGALSGFHPFIISVWGTDIYTFPRKSFFHRKLLEFNFRRADKILSTSNTMALEIHKFTDKKVEVTPFGIDVEKFKPMAAESIFNRNDIVIGTIKTLEEKYGIEFLVRAFKLVKEKHPGLPLKLLIVGKGSSEKYLKELAAGLGIAGDTVFTGYVEPKEIPRYHNMLDIYLALSTDESESFGVAVLEASACGKPVIVSNIGGLKEVVENNVTGLFVEPKNVEQAAHAIEKIILNEELRKTLGSNGRNKVLEVYNWEDNLQAMISIYKHLVADKSWRSLSMA